MPEIVELHPLVERGRGLEDRPELHPVHHKLQTGDRNVGGAQRHNLRREIVRGVGLHVDGLAPDGGVRGTGPIHNHEQTVAAIAVLVLQRPHIMGILVNHKISRTQTMMGRICHIVVIGCETAIASLKTSVHHHIILFCRGRITHHLITC